MNGVASPLQNAFVTDGIQKLLTYARFPDNFPFHYDFDISVTKRPSIFSISSKDPINFQNSLHLDFQTVHHS